MDVGTALLLAVIAVLAINQALMRVERIARIDRVYWIVQGLDLGVAFGLVVKGLPGFEGYPAVSPVLALLFVLHVAQNYNARAIRRSPQEDDERAEIYEEARRRREARDAEER